MRKKSETLAARHGDPRLHSLSDHKHISGSKTKRNKQLLDDKHTQQNKKKKMAPSGEGVALAVLQVGDLEGSRVLLTSLQSSNTALVGAGSDHAHVSGLEVHEVQHFASGEVELHGVSDFGSGVDVADSAAVVGHGVRDRAYTKNFVP